jgi:transposase-like protein
MRRKGDDLPARYSCTDRVVAAAVSDMVAGGVSTRRFADVAAMSAEVSCAAGVDSGMVAIGR